MAVTLKEPSGIRCSIYQWNRGNCSAGGISSKTHEVTLILPGGGPVTPDESMPAVQLVRRNLFGRVYVHAEPVEPCPSWACRMMGGTFIYASDSRFDEAVNNGGYPVALHDRVERV